MNSTTTEPRPLLIVDDDSGLLRQLRWAFSEHKVHAAADRREAVALIRAHQIPVAILDLGLPSDPDGASEGLAALSEIRELSPATKIIIATGNETCDHALRAIALGAYDFYQKPIDIEVLRMIVGRAEQMFELEAENRRLTDAANTISPIDGIIATSPEMLAVRRNIEKLAPTDVAVLLLGESGTGKELLAHAIHKLSCRAEGPFVPINCAAIPETLLESDLFGHEKGAFTGAIRLNIGRIESAHHGTLFLDEIGDVPLAMQVKLLRFLQDRIVERIGGRRPIQVDVRIVCATNQDLDRMMAEGRFREDLFYRLNEVTIRVPALRERPADAVVLSSFFCVVLQPNMGELARAKGDVQAAKSDFDAALQIDPQNVARRLSRASLNIAQGKYEAADEDLNPILKTSPNNFMANYLRAVEEGGQKQYAAADRLLDRLSPAFDQFPAGYYVQGAIKLELGQYAQAEAILAKYLDRARGDAKAARLAAFAALRQRAPDRAIEYLKPLAARPKAEADTLTLLGNAYMASGKPELALQQFEKAAALEPNDPTIDTRMAISEIGSGQGKEGVAELERVFSKEAGVPIAGPTLILAQLRAGQLDKAAGVAAALVKRDGNNPLYLTLSGMVKTAQKDVAGAAAAFRAALAQNPDFAPAMDDLAALYLSSGRLDDAKTVYQAALAKKPDNENALLGLVNVAINQKKWSEATGLLETAAAAHPSNGTLTTALAALYHRTGHFSKAEALLAGQLKTNPKNAQAAVLLGSLYLKTFRSADAQRVYDALLAQNSDDFAARLGLADVAIFENKWSEAADQIKQAAKLNPESAAPGLKLVELYIRSRDWKNATATAIDLAAKFPDNVDVIDAQARAQIGAGDKQAAIASYKHAYELDPNSSKILARYVEALNSAKQYAESQSILRKALDHDPQNSTIKADLIQVAADIGGVDAGLTEARDLARKDPDNLIYDMVSADLLDKGGRGKEAIGLFERDLASKPTNDKVRAQLATLYVRTGQPDKAETLLSARLKDDSTDYPAAQMLASLYLQSKDYDAAIAQYNKLLQSRPTDPTALNNLAWLYQQKGDLTKARELAERAAAAAPNAPQIDDTLGWILLAQGDAAKAITYLTAANVSAPADPSIAYHLAVALQRAGHSADAQTVLEKLLGSGAAFTEKPEAEKLLADIKHS